jgi:hypothetical protein
LQNQNNTNGAVPLGKLKKKQEVAQSGQKEEGGKEITVEDLIGAMRITRLSFGALGFAGVDGGVTRQGFGW